jgi:hypothetical protein
MNRYYIEDNIIDEIFNVLKNMGIPTTMNYIKNVINSKEDFDNKKLKKNNDEAKEETIVIIKEYNNNIDFYVDIKKAGSFFVLDNLKFWLIRIIEDIRNEQKNNAPKKKIATKLILPQYVKNIGRTVEVTLKDGKEKEGVLLLIEPEPGLLIETADQFLEFMGHIKSPMVGCNFDIGHSYCVGDDPASTIPKLAKYIKHFHLEDIASTRVHHHLIPGDGAIDFKAAIEAIKAIGYKEWVTIELYPYVEDPDQAAKLARERFAPLLA